MIEDEKPTDMLAKMNMSKEDLQEHPDDRFEEEIDEFERMVHLLRKRDVHTEVRLVAAQLLLSIRLSGIEMGLLSFNDNVMQHLENADATKGPAMIKWTTEEMLKHYNPEVLEIIKRGDAEMEVYDDRVVFKVPKDS